MFGIFVPEVKGAVAAGRREGTVLRVEGDCVHGVDFGHVSVVAVVDTVAFEGEVCTGFLSRKTNILWLAKGF